MSTLTDTVQNAQRKAAEIRPQVGGFPVLAEVLRQAGIRRNEWTLPAGQSEAIAIDRNPTSLTTAATIGHGEVGATLWRSK